MTEEQKQYAITLRKGGMSMASIAAEMGVHYHTIYRALPRELRGRRARDGRPRKFTDADLTALHEQGLDRWEIAKQLGCGETAVRMHLQRLGLYESRRERSE